MSEDNTEFVPFSSSVFIGYLLCYMEGSRILHLFIAVPTFAWEATLISCAKVGDLEELKNWKSNGSPDSIWACILKCKQSGSKHWMVRSVQACTWTEPLLRLLHKRCAREAQQDSCNVKGDVTDSSNCHLQIPAWPTQCVPLGRRFGLAGLLPLAAICSRDKSSGSLTRSYWASMEKWEDL